MLRAYGAEGGSSVWAIGNLPCRQTQSLVRYRGLEQRSREGADAGGTVQHGAGTHSVSTRTLSPFTELAGRSVKAGPSAEMGQAHGWRAPRWGSSGGTAKVGEALKSTMSSRSSAAASRAVIGGRFHLRSISFNTDVWSRST